MSTSTSLTHVQHGPQRRRLILPLALLGLGLLILIYTPLQVTESATDPVGPRFLPYLTGVAVTIGGVADLIMELARKTPNAHTRFDEQGTNDLSTSRGALLTSYVLILVGIVVWVYATVLLGYALSSLILMALTAVAFGLKKPVQMLILIVVTVGVTYYVFAELLQVQLILIGW